MVQQRKIKEIMKFRSKTQAEYTKEYQSELYEKSIKQYGEDYIHDLPLRINTDLQFIKSMVNPNLEKSNASNL